jgi:hypothetical protein
MGDWRNPDEYPLPEGLEPWEWAWQFLRRNPDYQADFHAALDRFWAREDDFSQLVAERNGPEFKPDSIPNVECRHKWYVEYYLDPEIEQPTVDPFLGFVDLYMANTHLWPLQNHEVLVRFDLRRPLPRQLKRALAVMEPRQTNMAARGRLKLRRPNLQRERWPLYLRLLDARAAGASYREIAAELLPKLQSFDRTPESTVDSPMRRALRMCRADVYRDILLMA